MLSSPDERIRTFETEERYYVKRNSAYLVLQLFLHLPYSTVAFTKLLLEPLVLGDQLISLRDFLERHIADFVNRTCVPLASSHGSPSPCRSPTSLAVVPLPILRPSSPASASVSLPENRFSGHRLISG